MGFPHLGVADRWPATPRRARYKRINMQTIQKDRLIIATAIYSSFTYCGHGSLKGCLCSGHNKKKMRGFKIKKFRDIGVLETSLGYRDTFFKVSSRS